MFVVKLRRKKVNLQSVIMETRNSSFVIEIFYN